MDVDVLVRFASEVIGWRVVKLDWFYVGKVIWQVGLLVFASLNWGSCGLLGLLLWG